jgi:uncharacterized membrane-anchored protein
MKGRDPMPRSTTSEDRFIRSIDNDDVGDRPDSRRGPLAVKVPEITAVFWILKLLTTAMGEAASDYLLHALDYLGLTLGVVGFVVAVGLQLRSRRYQPLLYWAAVSMVAVAGTMAADVVHGELGVPLPLSTLLCAAALAVTFLWWWRSEGTLSIHSITTGRREAFYWLAVSFTFALGTAAGDLTADQLGLGFVGSIALFAVAMAVPAVGWWRLGLNGVAAFWCAYVLTRPLGASLADWLSKPAGHGGMGLGDGRVAAVLLAAIVVTITGIWVRRVARPRADTAVGSRDCGS